MQPGTSGYTVQSKLKMNGNIIYKAGVIGTINGIMLGLIMKWIEMFFGMKVYTLLLNVDFLPVIGTVPWGEEFLFVFHLLFSIAITWSYVHFVIPLKIFKNWNKYSLAFLTIMPVILLYFPLAAWSLKEAVLPSDLKAFIVWSILHLIYALSLPKAI
ncbi:hypothetical protein MPH61_08385 [Peribacillus muralis]|uniref:hypothetical protein n=1 Tax=Peribacillus muralis TaxID=264697 RepID=UPI001F4D66C6|nr:hypothetical protein [Peribacillus muralis]MCK1992616.1 hypothetical protein [Peribacillus muralis]MCK2013172.1 hypothetical protein [Peribacillus muralis]